MIHDVLIQAVIPQSHVDIHIGAVLFITWDFIAVDCGKLISVLVVFVDDNGIFLRISIQGIRAEQFIVLIVFIGSYLIANRRLFPVIITVIGIGNILAARFCFFCNTS